MKFEDQYLILQSIEEVRDEFKTFTNSPEKSDIVLQEIFGRLVSLYSCLDVKALQSLLSELNSKKRA